jgi:hypothetical protein
MAIPQVASRLLGLCRSIVMFMGRHLCSIIYASPLEYRGHRGPIQHLRCAWRLPSSHVR